MWRLLVLYPSAKIPRPAIISCPVLFCPPPLCSGGSEILTWEPTRERRSAVKQRNKAKSASPTISPRWTSSLEAKPEPRLPAWRENLRFPPSSQHRRWPTDHLRQHRGWSTDLPTRLSSSRLKITFLTQVPESRSKILVLCVPIELGRLAALATNNMDQHGLLTFDKYKININISIRYSKSRTLWYRGTQIIEDSLLECWKKCAEFH